MDILIAAALLAGAQAAAPEVEVKAPRKVCELTQEIGSLRKRRVCYTEEQRQQRRDQAQQIVDQHDRERQLIKDNAGDTPLP